MAEPTALSDGATTLAWGLPVISSDAHLDAQLAARFDEWMRGTGSLLIEAPHGYGKSTHLAVWLREQAKTTPVIWIGQSDFVGTWQAARSTLVHALVQLGLAAEGLDADDLPAVYVAFQSLTQPVILVHDDFDLLLPSRSLSRLEVVSRQFPQLRNIYTTSSVADEDDADADPDRVVITRRELSWSRDFAAAVLGQRLGESRAAHRLDDVIDATGGRASAILEFFGGRSRVGRSRDSVAEFHTRWLLERANVADPTGLGAVLLLDLAQFIEVPLSFLRELGHPDAGAVVSALVREGLVSVTRSAFGNHSVVSLREETRRSLIDRSNSILGAARNDIHVRAAAHFEQQDSAPLAAYHYARAGNHARAMELLARPISLDDRGEGLLVARAAFQQIPLDMLGARPELLAMRVIAAHTMPVESIQLRGDAELRLLSLIPDSIAALPLRDRAAIATATVAALLGRNRSSDAVVRGRALVGELDGLPWDEVRGLGAIPGLLWTFLAEAELVNCDVRRALDLSSAASEWNQELGHPTEILRSSAVRAAANAMEGDLDYARLYIAEAEAAITFHELPASSAPLTLTIARFFVALAELDEAAMGAVGRAVRRQSPGEGPWSGLAAAAEAYAHLFSGRVMEAYGASRSVLRIADSRATPLLVRHVILGVHSDALLACGRPGEVLALLETVIEPPAHPFCYASRKAGAALAMGDAIRAVRLTEECMSMGSRHSGGSLASALIRRAAAHESLRMPVAADTSFSNAMALLSRKGCASAFLNLSAVVLVPLWVRLGNRDPLLMAQTVALTDPAALLVQLMPSSTAPISVPPEKLSDRELEVLANLYEKRTYKQIGDRMFVSENTVKTHVSRIYRKLHTTSRKESIDLALKLGLIDPRKGD